RGALLRLRRRRRTHREEGAIIPQCWRCSSHLEPRRLDVPTPHLIRRAPSKISLSRGVRRVWCRVRIQACEDHALRPAASSHNFIPFTPQGRLIALAGFGSLACKTDIFDRPTFSKVCTIDAPNTSYCAWSPDGRFLLTATLHDCALTAEARYGTSPARSCTSSPSRSSTRRRGGPRPSTRLRRSRRRLPQRSSPCRSPCRRAYRPPSVRGLDKRAPHPPAAPALYSRARAEPRIHHLPSICFALRRDPRRLDTPHNFKCSPY
ncbi:eukaryotic translation initiation factor eIF2A-domain-containing protein, partial [Mycena rebaudengoi]